MVWLCQIEIRGLRQAVIGIPAFQGNVARSPPRG
jgi:hypothetical protein